ncbi:MAG: hypothetical protein HFE31_00050 [Clostridia bacterium]|nr:hypothetical protein [Clostridia bacterium]
MLKTTLPIQSKKLDSENNLKIIKEDITVDIDTSIFAEQRWETNFPANATRETLFAYIERIDKEKLIDTAHILTNLKALFCFLESDAISDFKSFCQLFDLADEEYLKQLIDKIKYVFNIVLNSSAAKSKN